MTTLIPKPKKVRVWNKGQITIPSVIRKNLNINNDTILIMTQVGNAIFLTKKEIKSPKFVKKF